MLRPGLYRFVSILASISISALFIYLAVRQVDLSESAQALRSLDPVPLVLAALVFLSSYPVRALRWRRVLWEQKKLTLRQTLVPVFVGYMANNLLPARAGELYRAHFLGRYARTSRSGAAASIVVERTFDGLMLVLFILLTSLLFPVGQLVGTAALFVGAGFLVLAAGILAYVLFSNRTHWILDWALGLLPARFEKSVGERVRLFLHGIRGISTLRGVLTMVAYTAVIWGLEVGAYALVVFAFGVALPASGYLLLYTLTTLSTMLPSGPASIGPYQYAFVLALGVFSVSRGTALAVSVGAQFAFIGLVTVIGLSLLWREQVRGYKIPEQEDTIV